MTLISAVVVGMPIGQGLRILYPSETLYPSTTIYPSGG